MTTLSEPTISAIVNALLEANKSAGELAAFWDARVQKTPAYPDAVEYQRMAHEQVEMVENALSEMCEKFAPWLRKLNECKPMFETKTSVHPNQENP